MLFRSNVEAAPKIIKTIENPIVKKTIGIKFIFFLSISSFKELPEIYDIYPGIRGKTHGDKKLINPAPKAIINSNIKYYINLLFFIRMNFMFLCS